jgi:hypothetical protein
MTCWTWWVTWDKDTVDPDVISDARSAGVAGYFKYPSPPDAPSTPCLIELDPSIPFEQRHYLGRAIPS